MTRDLLANAIAGLSPEHRVVVALRYYTDLPVNEIASRLDIPAGTVQSRLHYALKRLHVRARRGRRQGNDPMTDEELERRLRNWYREDIPADETAPIALRARLEAIPRASPFPRRRSASRRGVTLLAAAALVGLLAGSAVVGGFLTTRPVPPVVPSQLPSVLPSGPQSIQPSIAPAMGRIIYTRWRLLVDGEEDCDPPGKFGHCRRASIFTSNADGSNERESFPEPSSNVIAASSDGSKLIVSIIGPEGDNLYLTDINGSQPHLIDTKCVDPCLGDGEFAFSPDGSRLAFARGIAKAGTPDQIGSVIAIMDLATGTVVQLDSTYASNPDLGDPCHSNCGEGDNRGPSWSPDGEHLLFPRTDIGIPNTPLSRKRFFNDKTVFVVDVDDRNLRQLTSKKLYIGSASWSPDGSLIVLTRSRDTLAAPGVDNWQQLNDIYVVRPDGTGLAATHHGHRGTRRDARSGGVRGTEFPRGPAKAASSSPATLVRARPYTSYG